MAPASLPGCASTLGTYRYRLTLEIDDNGRLVTGSSVVEVRYTKDPNWSHPPGMRRYHIRGESTLVDLGGGRLLIALLCKKIGARFHRGRVVGWGYRHPGPVIFRIYGLPENEDGLPKLLSYRGQRNLDILDLPDLVTFGDPNSPKSVKSVDPHDLITPFGPGIGLKRATLGITDDSVTSGLAKRLPWLDNKELQTGYLGGRTSFGTSAASTFMVFDFRGEE